MTVLLALIFSFLGLRISLGTRLILAVLIGFFLDSIFLIPFGSHVIALIGLAILCEIFRTIFSDTRSRAIHSVGVVFLAGGFIMMLFVSTLLVARVAG